VFAGNFREIRGTRLVGTYLPPDLCADRVALVACDATLWVWESATKPKAVVPCLAEPRPEAAFA
jgi:hypothetical protein